MKIAAYRILAISLLTLAPLFKVAAQCAMCAATVESNGKMQQKGFFTGLNIGILMLLVMPYLLFATVGYLWYSNAKKKKAQLQAQARTKNRPLPAPSLN